MKTKVICFRFHFVLLYFPPNKCPGLGQQRPGNLLGEKTMYVARNENEKKDYMGFRIPKV